MPVTERMTDTLLPNSYFLCSLPLLIHCRKMIMRLLALLDKILGEIRRQMRVHPDEELLNAKQLDMLETVTRVYRQQKNHFKSGDSRESIPNRIVSVSKPYIRPIVRGKETKTVEFGAKCNNILIDGISFIEKQQNFLQGEWY